MTIYAIANGLAKTLQSGRPIWTLISPAAILQGGNPYFVPDFASRFEARPALAVRIGKLGKGIAPRFASRYVDAVAPAVVFIASDLLDSLQSGGMPWTSALSYDRSVAIGRFQQPESDTIDGYRPSVVIESQESDTESTCVAEEASVSFKEALEAISRDNTFKTGDILLLGLTEKGIEVRPGLKATLRLNDTESLRFNIR